MADYPLRLRVQMAVCDALREITPANGYVNDLSGTGKQAKVFRGRSIFGENDPLPMISILEPPLPADRSPDPDGSQTSKGSYELIIQGFTKDDKVNPTDNAHILAADIMTRLAKEKQRETGDQTPFGFKRIQRIVLGPPVVRPPDDVISSQAFVWISMSLVLAENLLKPYEE